ncbi:hypothetical protein GCM10009535_60970 [Streptomyces thermocarboxydovorans]|uniref:Uncharacterized protein n=1 Tax=Streptomyces thermocarboxydovorans TaxID=59298 RepID=A0ABP3T4Z8_9ACTN
MSAVFAAYALGSAAVLLLVSVTTAAAGDVLVQYPAPLRRVLAQLGGTPRRNWPM